MPIPLLISMTKRALKQIRMKHPYLLINAIFTLLLLFASSCTCSKESTIKKKKDISSTDGKIIISAPIVSKPFVKKNGEPTDRTELYIRRSIQDYFIKFCESEVTREALEDHLSSINGFVKAVSLEVEFRKGEWDVCDENLAQQSRIGEYIVIHRIVN